ncbi:MAG: type restriction enzyme subunit [Actinomycetota bacterium]|nr:type restriction enzyme subunit [Actinomycetota bacterium]MEA2844521.1 type restriction enzyme subunit [Actinomycetota bacterium]
MLDDLFKEPDEHIVEVEIKINGRLLRRVGDPKFVALSERLENLRVKHEQGLLASLDFLKQLIDLAKDVVEAEKEI